MQRLRSVYQGLNHGRRICQQNPLTFFQTNALFLSRASLSTNVTREETSEDDSLSEAETDNRDEAKQTSFLQAWKNRALEGDTGKSPSFLREGSQRTEEQARAQPVSFLHAKKRAESTQTDGPSQHDSGDDDKAGRPPKLFMGAGMKTLLTPPQP